MGPALNPALVPPALHSLIPLAAKWGVCDDLERESLVDNASAEEIAELKATIEEFNDQFDEWLAGKESEGPIYSDEYIAFSAMRMAADYA